VAEKARVERGREGEASLAKPTTIVRRWRPWRITRRGDSPTFEIPASLSSSSELGPRLLVEDQRRSFARFFLLVFYGKGAPVSSASTRTPRPCRCANVTL